MKLTPLESLFDVEYGNQLDKNKLSLRSRGINFVSRSSKNLGIDGKVDKILDKEPYEKELITVTLGGTYLLSSFVQPEPFYTAQNVKVLHPKQDMSFNKKVFYCCSIEKNRFRYTSHGREANKTLEQLLVPSLENIPDWVERTHIPKISSRARGLQECTRLATGDWQPFTLNDLFDVEASEGFYLKDIDTGGNTPYVSATEFDNGVSAFVGLPPANPGNVLTVSRGGSVGKTFYQAKEFLATPDDIRVLRPKFELNPFIGLFLSVVIEREKFRFNYSRKMGTEYIKKLQIRLPAKDDGLPDWVFMENYIKSLPYSFNL